MYNYRVTNSEFERTGFTSGWIGNVRIHTVMSMCMRQYIRVPCALFQGSLVDMEQEISQLEAILREKDEQLSSTTQLILALRGSHAAEHAPPDG